MKLDISIPRSSLDFFQRLLHPSRTAAFYFVLVAAFASFGLNASNPRPVWKVLEAVLIVILLVLIFIGFNRKGRSYRPGMEALLVAAFSITLIEHWWRVPYPAPSYVYVFLVLAASLLYGTRNGLMLAGTIALLVLASTQLFPTASPPKDVYLTKSILIGSLLATALLAGHLTIGQRRRTQILREELLMARVGPLGKIMERDSNLRTFFEPGDEHSGDEIESLQESIRSILQRIKECLGAHSVLLYQPYGEKSLALRYFVSDTKDFDRSRLLYVEDTLLGQIFSRRVSCNWNLDDPSSQISFKDIPYYTAWKPIRQVAGCPLRFSDLTLGILVVDRVTLRVFTEVELLHLEIFAIQLVEMIQVGKLYLDQLDRNKEYRLFYKAMTSLGQSLNTQEVLESLANISEDVVPCSHLIIALLEDNGMTYRVAVSRGNPELVGQKIKSHGRTWISWILNADPGPVLLKDIQAHPSKMPIASPNETDLPVRSVLFIPLKAKEQKLGVLFLGSGEPDTFHHRHFRMLKVICQHASANIENSLLHQRVESEALSDGLTQLHNHRYFQERLAKDVSRARRNKSELTLLMADIDHFKSVNDTYGHRIGDMILQRVAEVLKKTIRSEDSIARYGGEEFVIILTDSDRKGGLRMAERLRKAVERDPFGMEDTSVKISISIGAATYAIDGTEPWELIEHADQALYAAKEQGRNRTVQYHTIIQTRNSAS